MTNEIDLREDEYVAIGETTEKGWWLATNGRGERGWIPSGWVKLVEGDEDGSAPIR